MRIQISQQVMRFLRSQAAPPEFRRMIESLRTDPYPEWARKIPDKPNWYEVPIAGYWMIYEVDTGGPETVIRVAITENI